MRVIRLNWTCAVSSLLIPGDYLKRDEDENRRLKRCLHEHLAPPSESCQFDLGQSIDNDQEIGVCFSQWWTPNLEAFMVGN